MRFWKSSTRMISGTEITTDAAAMRPERHLELASRR